MVRAACCLRQPAWLHGTRCLDTALAHRLQMPIVSSRGGDGNSPAAPTVRLAYVCSGIVTAGRRLVQVRLAGGTTWALPPSAGKCTQHTVWGRAGKARARAERTRTSVRMFQASVPTSAGARGSRQKKHHWRAGRAVAATGVPSVLKRRRRSLNLIPTDHMQRHRSPGPKRFGLLFLLWPSKYFLHQVYITAWLHNTATHRSRRPWRECVIGSFAAAAVRQGLGRASLRGDAVH